MAPKVHPSKLLTYIASIFAITLWGMSYIWTDKLIAQNIPIFYFVFVRILLAGAILFLFNTAYGRIKRIQKKAWPKFRADWTTVPRWHSLPPVWAVEPVQEQHH